MQVIVITVNEKNEMEMTTNVSQHQDRINVLKSAVLKELKPKTLTEKLKGK